jgi:Xaa-Pro aminopeptidase
VHVVPAAQTEFGSFLAFETLTLFPIDRNLIAVELLTAEELEWLNAYHARVYEVISPALTDEENSWLQQKCKPI